MRMPTAFGHGAAAAPQYVGTDGSRTHHGEVDGALFRGMDDPRNWWGPVHCIVQTAAARVCVCVALQAISHATAPPIIVTDPMGVYRQLRRLAAGRTSGRAAC